MLRKSDGLTQSQVAQALNIGTQAYSYYERGDREPPLELLCKMADYFHESKAVMDRPDSAIAENFIREFGELFSDDTFQSYAKLYKLMDARQRIFVLGMIVGWLKEQGITVKNL